MDWGKTQLVLFDWSNNTGDNDVKMNGFVLEEKPSCKMLGLAFLLNSIEVLTLSLGPVLQSKACVQFFRKRAKYLIIWAKMYKFGKILKMGR